MSELITAEEALEEEILEEEQLEDEILEEEEEVESLEEEEVEPSEEEEKAKKYGHLSKDEWIAQGRDPKLWKSPEDFNRTGEIIDQIYSMKKKIDQRDREIQALVDYQKRTSEREYANAKKDLEARLAAAKDDMDMEATVHYTKELTRLEDMEQNNQEQEINNQRQQALNSFIERNQHWYNDRNRDLQQRAAEIDNELKSIYPNATFDELAQKIEARMKYEFPERVEGRAQAKPPSISHSRSSVNKTAASKSSPKRDFNKLPQELKDTYNATKRIIESRGDVEYSISDFMEQLKKDGEI